LRGSPDYTTTLLPPGGALLLFYRLQQRRYPILVDAFMGGDDP
jgi:hypothetical protein